MNSFLLLPEECLSEILKRASPRDVCLSSSISRGFKSVADSDDVWVKFLPSDHAEIVSRAQSPLLFTTYKHLYLRLANQPLILDEGNLSFAIEKDSGKKCYMLGARQLTITWGSSPEYWSWESILGSRFAEVAILMMVWWFEIICKIETKILSPNTAYVAFLVFKVTREFDGFELQPINVSFKSIREIGDEDGDEMMNSTVYLKPISNEPMPEGGNSKIPQKRNGGWYEVELGEFFNYPGDNRQLEIRIFEVEQGSMKTGLVVEGIEFRPKAIV